MPWEQLVAAIKSNIKSEENERDQPPELLPPRRRSAREAWQRPQLSHGQLPMGGVIGRLHSAGQGAPRVQARPEVAGLRLTLRG